MSLNESLESIVQLVTRDVRKDFDLTLLDSVPCVIALLVLAAAMVAK